MRFTFESAFAPHIVGLIKQKRADGFDYYSSEVLLKRFDTFCLSHFPDAKVIDREINAEWSVIRPTEGKNYRNRRMTVLRQLCLYMSSLGLETYIPHGFGSNDKSLPYIPSREEMSLFFKELDAWKSPAKLAERTAFEYRIIFRLYYCCGLRLSEARLLKKENVDFEKGILTILHSKGQKDRLVYLPQGGTVLLREYLYDIEKTIPNSPWLFPGRDPSTPLSCLAIEKRFENCWNRLHPVANTDKHPTPHCLRHAFVVERMNDWMQQGVNTKEMLPYLSKYLGHKSTSETFYYYHLVNKASIIIKQKDKVSNRVIPEVYDYEDF